MPTSTPEHAELARLERLGRVMDSAIAVPGTNIRVGLDPILGLIPGLGDWAGALASGYILVRSAALGAGRATLLRMAGNIGVDVLVGTVPVLGDIFDLGFRANQRNLELLRKHLAAPVQRRRTDRWFVAGLIGALVLLVVATIALSVWLISALVHAVAGT